jgi:Icc protein
MRGRLVAVTAVLAAACFEYSPHAIVLDDSERGLTEKAIARLQATPPPSALRFAVVGDTQLAFDEAADAIEHLNGRDDLSFVVQIGDFTNFGLGREFVLMSDVFARLRVPFFVVIGIHEYLGNGEDIYARMFGARDVAFTYARTRVVLFDDNSREFAFDGTVPDLGFLAAQLAPDGAHDLAVLFAHVPPGTSDFDPALVDRYDELLRTHAPVVSFHGHEPAFRFEEREGTPLYVTDPLDEQRTYLVATVLPGGRVEVERIAF